MPHQPALYEDRARGGGVTVRRKPGGHLRLLGPRAPAPLSRARKVASWQARLLSLTTTRIRAASAVQAVQYLPSARNVPNGRAARDKGEGRGLHQGCMRNVGKSPRRGGHFPTHFPTSRLSPFFVPTSEPSEKVPYCDVVVHFPIRLYFSDTQHPGFRRLFQIYPSYVGYCSTITRYLHTTVGVQQSPPRVSNNSFPLLCTVNGGPRSCTSPRYATIVPHHQLYSVGRLGLCAP